MTAGALNSVTFRVPASYVGCIGCIKLFLRDGRSMPDLLIKQNRATIVECIIVDHTL